MQSSTVVDLVLVPSEAVRLYQPELAGLSRVTP
jgi:hypothetical protein